ncbi:Protoporphyrinogen oxidase (fragment) [Burkholderiales bacterium 8X]
MSSIFRSFWMGGFEGADHVNSRGMPLSMNEATSHWKLLEEDYARLERFGIRTVRESVGWRVFDQDPDGPARLARQAAMAQRHGLQVIWTLHHYGLPPGVDFFADDFAASFASFCERAARCILPWTDGPPIFQPINEISFLSWAASSTDAIHPYRASSPTRGYELKCRLAQAAVRGCDALWSMAPDARMVHTDPIIHVIPTDGSGPIGCSEAEDISTSQFQAWDMIAGRIEPALGGHPRYLDILGANYYHANQWEHPSNERLHWHRNDPRRRDLADMLGDLQERYARPVFIAETGHVGEGRAEWISEIASAVDRCGERGMPIEGVCLYPIVDRHDWEDPSHWHRCGLWDLPGAPGDARRILHEPMAHAIGQANGGGRGNPRVTLHQPDRQNAP